MKKTMLASVIVFGVNPCWAKVANLQCVTTLSGEPTKVVNVIGSQVLNKMSQTLLETNNYAVTLEVSNDQGFVIVLRDKSPNAIIGGDPIEGLSRAQTDLGAKFIHLSYTSEKLLALVSCDPQ